VHPCHLKISPSRSKVYLTLGANAAYFSRWRVYLCAAIRFPILKFRVKENMRLHLESWEQLFNTASNLDRLRVFIVGRSSLAIHLRVVRFTVVSSSQQSSSEKLCIQYFPRSERFSEPFRTLEYPDAISGNRMPANAPRTVPEKRLFPLSTGGAGRRVDRDGREATPVYFLEIEAKPTIARPVE